VNALRIGAGDSPARTSSQTPRRLRFRAISEIFPLGVGVGGRLGGGPILTAMHYQTHQPVVDDLEARILTIRDSL